MKERPDVLRERQTTTHATNASGPSSEAPSHASCQVWNFCHAIQAKIILDPFLSSGVAVTKAMRFAGIERDPF